MGKKMSLEDRLQARSENLLQRERQISQRNEEMRPYLEALGEIITQKLSIAWKKAANEVKANVIGLKVSIKEEVPGSNYVLEIKAGMKEQRRVINGYQWFVSLVVTNSFGQKGPEIVVENFKQGWRRDINSIQQRIGTLTDDWIVRNANYIVFSPS